MNKIITEVLNKLNKKDKLEELIKMGLKVGENFSMRKDCILDPSHCFLITIGNDVTLAPRVHILAHDASTKRYIGYTKIGRVNIGNKVFIGANVTILPNVTIGDNVIIGAGSIVTKNLESDSVYAGNPAKFICKTVDYINKSQASLNNRPVYGKEYTINDITEEMKQEMYEALEDGTGFIK